MRNFHVFFKNLKDDIVWSGECSEYEIAAYCQKAKNLAKKIGIPIKAKFYDEPKEFTFYPEGE